MSDKLVSEARKARILAVAVYLSQQQGYQWITRDQVSEACGASAGAVTSAFGSFVELKREVVREAIRTENLPIIAQAIVDGNTDANNAPEELKRKALEAFL